MARPNTGAHGPRLVAGIEPRRKKPLPIPPIGHIEVGSFVLRPYAVSILAPFLCQFGELLEVEFEGELVYFYNVTKLVSVVDEARSLKSASGWSIVRAAFRQEAIPSEPMLFKDPLTARSRLYATAAARAWLLQVLQQHNLEGLTFYEPGSLGKSLRE